MSSWRHQRAARTFLHFAFNLPSHETSLPSAGCVSLVVCNWRTFDHVCYWEIPPGRIRTKIWNLATTDRFKRTAKCRRQKRYSLTARRNSSNCSLFRQDLVIQILTTYLYVAASWNTQAPGTQAGVSCTKAIDERNVCHLPGFGLWTRTRLFPAGERSFYFLRAAFFSLFFQTYREHIEVFLKYSLSVGESFINPLLF